MRTFQLFPCNTYESHLQKRKTLANMGWVPKTCSMPSVRIHTTRSITDYDAHLVVHRGNIASTAGVFIPIPRPADIVTHLVDGQVYPLSPFLDVMGE